MLVSISVRKYASAKLRASLCLSVLGGGVFSLACSEDSAPTEVWRVEDDHEPAQAVSDPIVTQKAAPSDQQPKVGSGSIKSYFEETEKEPPLLTGSIFANGFTLGDGLGAAGAPAVPVLNDPVQQLGLGTGDLTVLVLFDRSVSMSDMWDGLPRWQVAGRAFMDGMVGFEPLVTIGTIFFPQAAECDVAPLSDPRQIQFQAGTRFKQQWEAYPQNRFPSGGTPLGPAFEEANEVINEALDYGLVGAGRRFRVAVVTDGKPNCGTDPDRVLQLASSWATLGVELHVIGLPGSDEAAVFLDQLAAAGGTFEHRAPVDQAQAEQELNIVLR